MIDSVQAEQDLEIKDRKRFAPEITKRLEACKENGYPICLEAALVDTYGENWRMKRIVEEDRVVTSYESESPRKIWKIYVHSVSQWDKDLGKEKTLEIETKALKEMEALQCQKCPMYEFELKRLGKK